MIHKREEILGGSGSGAICGGHSPAEPAAIIRDEAVTRAREGRDLMFPHVRATSESVQKNDRHAPTAGVLIKYLRSGNINESLGQGRLRLRKSQTSRPKRRCDGNASRNCGDFHLDQYTERI